MRVRLVLVLVDGRGCCGRGACLSVGEPAATTATAVSAPRVTLYDGERDGCRLRRARARSRARWIASRAPLLATLLDGTMIGMLTTLRLVGGGLVPGDGAGDCAGGVGPGACDVVHGWWDVLAHCGVVYVAHGLVSLLVLAVGWSRGRRESRTILQDGRPTWAKRRGGVPGASLRFLAWAYRARWARVRLGLGQWSPWCARSCGRRRG